MARNQIFGGKQLDFGGKLRKNDGARRQDDVAKVRDDVKGQLRHKVIRKIPEEINSFYAHIYSMNTKYHI